MLSIFSCLIKGFMSSSGLELVNGEEALLFGVDDAAPSTQRSPGAGSRGEAGGGVWTLLPVVFLPEMGADMLGLLLLIDDSGKFPSSVSLSFSLFV